MTSKALGRVGLSLVLVLAAVLRAWRIGDKNLWLDESVSWDSATASLRQLMWNSAYDIHPPLYYMVLKLWIWLWGDSLSAMRSLSAIASVVALYLLFRLVHGAMPRAVCYAVVLWCALSPHEVHYAQEIRMYALLTAATLGLCLAYRRWIESGGARRSALVLYAVAAAIALSLHYFAALAIAAIWLHFVFGGGRREIAGRRWRPWLVANTAVALAYTPWVIAAVTFSTWTAWFEPVGIGALPRYAAIQFHLMIFGYYEVPTCQLWPGFVTLGVIAGGAVLLLVAVARARDERDMFFASVAYGPMLVGLLLIPLVGDITLGRYLPYATPLMIAAAARGWSRTTLTSRWATAIICIGSLGLLPSLSVYYSARTKEVDPRPVVAYLMTHTSHAADGTPDRVFVAPGYVISLLRYYSRSSIDLVKVNSSDPDFSGSDFSRDGPHTWIVVERDWPNFHDFTGDDRLRSVDVPGNDPNLMRLFRLTHARGD